MRTHTSHIYRRIGRLQVSVKSLAGSGFNLQWKSFAALTQVLQAFCIFTETDGLADNVGFQW